MKRRIIVIYFILSLAVFLTVFYIYNISRDYSKIKKSEFLGNTDSIIRKLRDKEGNIPFSFAFISDTENNDSSIWLLENLLKEDIGFLVFTGDFANDATKEEHKLFWKTICALNPKVPIFFVSGNHDIDVKKREGKFTEEEFENLYGPSNFEFIYNSCLFVFVNNVDPNSTKSANYLEKVLSERGNDIKYTFLFLHSPLARLRDKAYMAPDCITLLDTVIEKYKIDYIICGDYHRHFELTEDNGTRYIISGSGGAHFHGETPIGRFKSGTKITVYNNCVTEELLVYDRVVEFTDNSIRHLIYKSFLPVIESRPVLLNTVFSMVIVNLLVSVFLVISKIMV
jgi:predicted MPP superfamily phosphohydrolase